MNCKTIVVCGQKGGSGKTTTAQALAIQLARLFDWKVLLVDADEQQSLSKFSDARPDELREKLKVAFAQMFKQSIAHDIRAQKENYDLIVVDSGGRAANVMKGAMLVSDLAIIPCRPGQKDVETLDFMETFVSEIQVTNPNLSAKVLVNQASSHNKETGSAEVIELVNSEYETMNAYDNKLCYRAIYDECDRLGKTIYEYKNDFKAKNEFNNFLAQVILDLEIDESLAKPVLESLLSQERYNELTKEMGAA